MMIFDSHAHYDDEAFEPDRDSILSSLPEKGVSKAVNCGCDVTSSEKAIALSEKFPFIYAAVGIHPENVDECDDISAIERLTKHDKCVAIGEVGLDYHYTKENKERQKEIFIAQIELSNRLGLPLIIHERDAYSDCLEILKAHTPKKAVMHCFSGNVESVREVLKLGLYIGVGGTLTFKNNKKTVEMLPSVPLERLLFETDAPYLSPEPMRGKRNDSSNIKYVAERAGLILGKEAGGLLKITYDNAMKFFDIKEA